MKQLETNEHELFCQLSRPTRDQDETFKQTVNKIKNRINHLFHNKERTRRPIPEEQLIRPVLTPSLENVLNPPPVQAPPNKKGRPTIDDFDQMNPKQHAIKLKPIIDQIKDLAPRSNKTTIQLAARILELISYPTNRKVAAAAKLIYTGQFDGVNAPFTKDEVQAMKLFDLGVSANRVQNLRLRILPYLRIHTEEELRAHAKLITCPTIPFLGGKQKDFNQSIFKLVAGWPL